MRVYISHATRNKEIVLQFAEFLESISSCARKRTRRLLEAYRGMLKQFGDINFEHKNRHNRTHFGF